LPAVRGAVINVKLNEEFMAVLKSLIPPTVAGEPLLICVVKVQPALSVVLETLVRVPESITLPDSCKVMGKEAIVAVAVVEFIELVAAVVVEFK